MAEESPQPAAREPIYRWIRRLMLFDLVLGLFLLVVASPLWGPPALQVAGLFLALIGGGLYLFFGRLAARAGRKKN